MAPEAFHAERVVRFTPSVDDATVIYLTEGGDRSALDRTHEPIDCDARVALCHAACCRCGCR